MWYQGLVGKNSLIQNDCINSYNCIKGLVDAKNNHTARDNTQFTTLQRARFSNI